MRVDRVIHDERKSLRQVLEGLDHNLTARDNFAPEGEEGWVLTSRGPDHIPEYRPVTLSPDASIDWDSITGTPATLAGYGIEDAYTIYQVNNLIATHTHDAAAIISGILNTPRLGSGVANERTYLRGDSTWQPLSLAGLGIASEVANFAAGAGLRDEECCDNYFPIPGARGVDGSPGPTGPPGSVIIIQEEAPEDWPLMFPGERGPQGTTGVGTVVTNIYQIVGDEGSGEEPWSQPPGVPGTGGISGSGTIGVHAKWTAAKVLGDSALSEAAGPTGTFAGDFIVGTVGSGIFWVKGTAPHIIWEENDQAADEKRWRMYPDAKTFHFQTLNDAFTLASDIWTVTRGAGIAPGEFQIAIGTRHLNPAYLQWGGDSTGLIFLRAAANNYQIRSNDDGAANQTDATKPSWAVTIGEGAADNFKIFRRAAGGAFVGLWSVPAAGHWIPGADNTYDLGTGALRVRDMLIAGELVGMNGVNGNTADQATFINVATNITGCAFDVLNGEVWYVDFLVPFVTTVGTGGCEFNITAPAGSTFGGNVLGCGASSTAFRNDLIVVVNAFTGILYGATATLGSSLFVMIRGVLVAGANGTVQLQGRSAAAGTTVQVKKGANVWARRKS